MNTFTHYIIIASIFVSAISCAAEKKNLLEDGFAAVAVSLDNIENIYLQAIEKDYTTYAQLGANWNDDGFGNDLMLAGIHFFEEPKILYIKDPLDTLSDIAFENVIPKDKIKLLKSDVAEINEIIISNYIQKRVVDPKPFDVNLD